MLLPFILTPVASAQSHLQYQNRGNRYEGIRPKPVSGYDIDLISARVDYKEEVEQMPAQLKVKFYLQDTAAVHLTVREVDYKYYYWMDKVRPSEPWRRGFDNVFVWPTQDVIRQLDEIKMYDLGVVARLQKSRPSKVERVAPAIFYHSQFPSPIKGYLFTFKTNGDALLSCSIYKEGEAEPVFTSIFPRQRGGRPFTVRWDSSQARKGSYRLVITGYFLNTSDPIDQTVRFYHQPIVE
ncbi:MAG: hypothetical protein GWN41_05035 [Phycisphaerae bacterium]|nr:hypothetical protein [Phycisphaerae bacterium]